MLDLDTRIVERPPGSKFSVLSSTVSPRKFKGKPEEKLKSFMRLDSSIRSGATNEGLKNLDKDQLIEYILKLQNDSDIEINSQQDEFTSDSEVEDVPQQDDQIENIFYASHRKKNSGQEKYHSLSPRDKETRDFEGSYEDELSRSIGFGT